MNYDSYLKPILIGLGALLFNGCNVGCNYGPSAMPREFAMALQQISTSMSDQAVWSNLSAGLNGQVINPGVQGYAGVLYVAGGKIEGFSGQINLSGNGTGSGALTPEARAKILEIVGDRAIAERVVDALLSRPSPAPANP